MSRMSRAGLDVANDERLPQSRPAWPMQLGPFHFYSMFYVVQMSDSFPISSYVIFLTCYDRLALNPKQLDVFLHLFVFVLRCSNIGSILFCNLK